MAQTYTANDIQVLEGLDAVRMRPGMYIGSTGPRGLHHMIWEIGILQERILEWAATPSSRGSSQPRDRTHVSYISYIGRQVLYYQCYLCSLITHCDRCQKGRKQDVKTENIREVPTSDGRSG